jgi:hypothetical protein
LLSFPKTKIPTGTGGDLGITMMHDTQLISFSAVLLGKIYRAKGKTGNKSLSFVTWLVFCPIDSSGMTARVIKEGSRKGVI